MFHKMLDGAISILQVVVKMLEVAPKVATEILEVVNKVLEDLKAIENKP